MIRWKSYELNSLLKYIFFFSPFFLLRKEEGIFLILPRIWNEIGGTPRFLFLLNIDDSTRYSNGLRLHFHTFARVFSENLIQTEISNDSPYTHSIPLLSFLSPSTRFHARKGERASRAFNRRSKSSQSRNSWAPFDIETAGRKNFRANLLRIWIGEESKLTSPVSRIICQIRGDSRRFEYSFHNFIDGVK